MRTLTLLLRSGNLVAEQTLFENERGLIIGDIDQIFLELSNRLDVLERDGPWKPEVQNSLQPAPKISDL